MYFISHVKSIFLSFTQKTTIRKMVTRKSEKENLEQICQWLYINDFLCKLFANTHYCQGY